MKKSIKLILIVAMLLTFVISFAGIMNVYATETSINNSDIELKNPDVDASKVSDTVGETGVETQGEVDPISLEEYLDESEGTEINYSTGDVYKCEENVTVSNNIDGNVFVMGNNVSIESESVIGDIFVLGKNVTIKSYVSGSIFACAENLTVQGTANDLYAVAANQITMGENSYIYRDVKACGTLVNSNGIINGNLYAYGDQVVVSEDPNTSMISGNIYYTGELVGGTTIAGEKIFVEDNEAATEVATTVTNTVTITSVVSKIFTALLIVGIIVLFTTARDNNFKSDINKKFITDTLLGLLMLIVIPIVSFILLVSIIGVGVGVILLIAYILLLVLVVKPIAAIEIAKKVTEKNKMTVLKVFALAVLVDLLFILIDNYLGFVGSFAMGIMSLYGLGLITRKGYNRLFHKEKNVKNEPIEAEVVSKKEIKDKKEDNK